MKNSPMNRRNFIKTCVTATVSASALSSCSTVMKEAQGPQSAVLPSFNAKGLPTRVLGKSGIAVPIIGIGAGSRFCRVEKLEDSVELLTTALDNGLYYWDTAPNYTTPKMISEERLGLVLKDRRKEVVVATKVEDLTADGAMRGFEQSLKRLQTDYVDILQVHSVDNLEEVEKIGGKGGAFEALRKLKEQKAVRLIGFSCHSSAATAMAMVERLDLDTMLIALNHQRGTQGDMEKAAIPAAANKGMGVMIIKAIRPRETVAGLNPEDLIRYALTLEHVNSAVIGTDSLEVLKKNIALLRNFRKMTPAEMREMSMQLRPFFEGRGLPWMRPGYRDGQPA